MRASISLTVLLLQLVALAMAFPAKDLNDDHDDGGDQAGPLPFLQFTKGGIKVNFGGYHAQAGLGGLLTGRAQDGGLHASAGMPSGAHASAGLGGSLTNGPEGGLHARAGLGNGGPEAEAGLSGSLTGPKPTGDIYSRAQIANGIEVQKNKGKNIQVIARPKKATESYAGIGDKSKEASDNADSTNRGEGNAVVDDNNEALRKSHPARWYFEKRVRERVAASRTNEIDRTVNANENLNPEKVEQADEPASSTSSTTATVSDEPAKSNKVSATPTSTTKAKANVEVTATTKNGNTRDRNENSSNGSGGYGNGFRLKYNKGSTFFDDIFNIPISALTAVNKLLKNHIGRK